LTGTLTGDTTDRPVGLIMGDDVAVVIRVWSLALGRMSP
jgi:hypothetical protein